MADAIRNIVVVGATGSGDGDQVTTAITHAAAQQKWIATSDRPEVSFHDADDPAKSVIRSVYRKVDDKTLDLSHVLFILTENVQGVNHKAYSLMSGTKLPEKYRAHLQEDFDVIDFDKASEWQIEKWVETKSVQDEPSGDSEADDDTDDPLDILIDDDDDPDDVADDSDGVEPEEAPNDVIEDIDDEEEEDDAPIDDEDDDDIETPQSVNKDAPLVGRGVPDDDIDDKRPLDDDNVQLPGQSIESEEDDAIDPDLEADTNTDDLIDDDDDYDLPGDADDEEGPEEASDGLLSDSDAYDVDRESNDEEGSQNGSHGVRAEDVESIEEDSTDTGDTLDDEDDLIDDDDIELPSGNDFADDSDAPEDIEEDDEPELPNAVTPRSRQKRATSKRKTLETIEPVISEDPDDEDADEKGFEEGPSEKPRPRRRSNVKINDKRAKAVKEPDPEPEQDDDLDIESNDPVIDDDDVASDDESLDDIDGNIPDDTSLDSPLDRFGSVDEETLQKEEAASIISKIRDDSDDDHGAYRRGDSFMREGGRDDRESPNVVDVNTLEAPHELDSAPYMSNLTLDERRRQKREYDSARRYGGVYRTNLGKVFCVTGTHGGAGKTTWSWLFAESICHMVRMAEEDDKADPNVWYIETDYANPKLQERFGLSTSMGDVVDFIMENHDRRVISQSEIRSAIESIVKVDEATGMRVLTCPYDIKSVKSADVLKFVMKKAVMLANESGGYVVIDSHNFTVDQFDDIDTEIAQKLSNYVIIVSEPHNVNELHRTIGVVKGDSGSPIRRSQKTIKVFLNKAGADQEEDIGRQIAPVEVKGGCRTLDELISDRSGGYDHGWVRNVGGETYNYMIKVAAAFMVDCGLSEFERVLAGNNATREISRPEGFFSRVMRRLLP